MDSTPRMMDQQAPYPEALESLVKRLHYKPGWTFRLTNDHRGQGCEGLTLVITILEFDSYNPDAGRNYRVHHLMPVPPAAYNERSWRRWLFQQFLLVEQHEAAEFFQIGEDRPYAPLHHDGNDPYAILEVATEDDIEAGRHR